MTDSDPVSRFLDGNNPYPFGVALREHIGNYVDHIPHIVALSASEAADLTATAQETEDTNRAIEILQRARDALTTANTMTAVHTDLSALLEFVDWEHSFHEVDGLDAAPGEKTLAVKLMKYESGMFGIRMDILNGAQVSAGIDLNREAVETLKEGFGRALEALDRAEAAE